jgi:hypothetical protein
VSHPRQRPTLQGNTHDQIWDLMRDAEYRRQYHVASRFFQAAEWLKQQELEGATGAQDHKWREVQRQP